MASYSKRMVELAALWLKANPDPDAISLNFPNRTTDVAVTCSQVDRIRALCAVPGATGRWYDDARALLSEYDSDQSMADMTRELVGLEDEIETLINRPNSEGHTKSTMVDEFGLRLCRWLLSWGRDGYNTFELTADFTAAMLLTDARSIDVTDVRLPFRGILMLIPDGFAVGVEGGSYTKIHISEVHPLDLIDKDRIRAFGTNAGRVARANLVYNGGCESLTDERTYGMLHIHADDGVRVMTTYIERRDLTWSHLDEIDDATHDDADRRAAHAIRHVVFGALAYMGSVQSACEPRVVSPKAARRTGSGQSSKMWDVGRTIRIAPQLVRAARNGSREVALRLKHRHIVRGHYREQAHGPRWSERTRRWISPFWKGPDDGAALVHTYRLDTAPDGAA